MISKSKKSQAITFILLFINALVFAQVKIVHYTSKDGIAHDICYQLMESKEGYLYIGTDNGLTRFNGKVFDVFQNPEANNQFVTDCIEAKGKGELILSKWGNGLEVLMKDGMFRNFIVSRTPPKISHLYRNKDFIFGYSGNSNLAVWKLDDSLYNKNYVVQIIDNSAKAIDPVSVQSKSIKANYFNLNVVGEKLFVFNHDDYQGFRGVYEFQESGQFIERFKFLNNSFVKSFQSGGSLYTALSNNQVVFFNDKEILYSYPSPVEKVKRYFFGQDYSAFITKSDKGDLIYLRNNRTADVQIITSETLGQTLVSDLKFTNDNQVLWISTFGNGLFKVVLPNPVFPRSWLHGFNCFNPIQVEDNIFFATPSDLILANDSFEVLDKFSLDKLYWFNYDPEQNTFFLRNNLFMLEEAEFHGKNVEINSKKFQRFGDRTFSYGESSFQVNFNGNKVDHDFRDLAPYPQNVIIKEIFQFKDDFFILTNHGLFTLSKDNLELKESVLNSDRRLKDKDFIAGCVRGDTFCLVGHSQLVVWKNDLVSFYDFKGRNRDHIRDVFISKMGKIWIATQKGIAYLNKDRFSFFGSKEGLNADFANSFFENSQGNLFVFTNNGVFQIDEQELVRFGRPKILIHNNYDSELYQHIIEPDDSLTLLADIINFMESDVNVEVRWNDDSWIPFNGDPITFEKLQNENYNIQFRARYDYSEYSYSPIISVFKRNYWYFRFPALFIWAALFFTIALLLVNWRLSQIKKKNEILKNVIFRNEALQHRLDAMRQEVAEDFHDELGNKIAGITFISDKLVADLSMTNDTSAVPLAQRINDDSRLLYQSVRDFLWSMDSKNDKVLQLIMELTNFGQELFEYTNIYFTVNNEVADLSIQLPDHWNRQILLIFKEVLTNAFKHSQASNVTLTISIDEGFLFVEVIDNGIGFQIDKVFHRSGLSNITQRANRINGSLKVDSSENGTQVVFHSSAIR